MKAILFCTVLLAAFSGTAEDEPAVAGPPDAALQAAASQAEEEATPEELDTIEKIRKEGREKLNETMDMLGELVNKTRELRAEPLETTVIPLEHASPSDMADLLDFFDAQIEPKEEFNAISVKATPEDLAAIEQLVKRFDVPMDRPNVELEFYVLAAIPTAPASSQAPPKQLYPAIEQIKKLYPDYNISLACTYSVRARDGHEFVLNDNCEGVPVKLAASVDTSGTKITLDQFMFRGSIVKLFEESAAEDNTEEKGAFTTSVSFEEGQYIVIGKSSLVVVPGPVQKGSVPVFLVVTGRIAD